MSEHALARQGSALLTDPASLPLLVHVDVGVLTGQNPDGRRHLDAGPVLSASTIRRLGCDASVIAITERDGTPINVGRTTRILPRALRRASRAATGPAASPAVRSLPRERTRTTSITGLPGEGPTNLDNLVSLCHFHHRRLHDGAYTIRGHPDAGMVFERSGGRPILRRPPGVDPEIPRQLALRAALGGGDDLRIAPRM